MDKKLFKAAKYIYKMKKEKYSQETSERADSAIKNHIMHFIIIRSTISYDWAQS